MTAQIVEVVLHSSSPAVRSREAAMSIAHPQNSIATFNVFKIKTSGN
jgi:hypothetical protein